jgi:hypothetical protein
MKRYILGVLVLAATAAAQQTAQQVEQQIIELQDKRSFEAAGALPGPAPMLTRFGGPSAVVKGEPYSAEAITEIIQVLADGNRIVNKTSNKSYRDSEGRSRMEITPSPAGAWMPDMKPFSVTVIDDPVSGDHITLNNNSKQASRFSFKATNATTTGVTGGIARAQNLIMVTTNSGDLAATIPASGPMHVTGSHATAAYGQSGANVSVNAFVSSGVTPEVKKESLGKQVIEGVECIGSKETATIPAGAVGNERTIESVTEHWYSSELQLEVLTKTVDPRFGETSYRLSNIIRAEQPKSLFEVPSDYKLEEPGLNFKVMKGDVK